MDTLKYFECNQSKSYIFQSCNAYPIKQGEAGSIDLLHRPHDQKNGSSVRGPALTMDMRLLETFSWGKMKVPSHLVGKTDRRHKGSRLEQMAFESQTPPHWRVCVCVCVRALPC